MAHYLRTGALALIVGLAITGCTTPQAGGQTGGQVGDKVCQEAPRSVDLDEQTPLGASASDILVWAEGSRTASLVWAAETTDSLASAITVEPAASTGSIELTVEYVDGSLRFIERTQSDSPSDGDDSACSDTLEIDVRVSVTTGNGALRDSFTGRLVASHPDHASLSVTLDLNEIEGDFVVMSADPGVRPAGFQLLALLTDDEFSGSIEGRLEVVRAVEGGGRETGDVPPELGEGPGDTPNASHWIRYGHFPAEL